MAENNKAEPASPPPMPQINVRAGLVRLVSTCMATNDIRYYLNGFLVEPRKEGGAYIVATDGHRMMAIIDESATCTRRTTLRLTKREAAQISALHMTSVAKKEVNEQRLKLIDVEGTACLALTEPMIKGIADSKHGIVTIFAGERVVEGKFSDWRRVLPNFEKLQPGLLGSVNVRYLYEPLVTGFKASSKIAPALNAWQTDKDSVIALSISACPNVIILVMPMRGDPIGSTRLDPTWAPVKEGREYVHPTEPDSAAADAVAVPSDDHQRPAGEQPATTKA